ncbi:MAG: restriction endonuclease subunit S [Microcystis sp. M049S2]|jgi:type I restriction enzyme S subunit|uniref:Restriction endonuclease subunit S n=1 Tax=Microcystis flos-aquae FACHB-1344 TaxID=2692899 RepID=A0ABR8I172_9CHRO|nr:MULTISPECIES: restriction endonuclease subunit S [Microcystis]MBD2624770.1 restriction endonuclease subunit S [Microcystis flos-aquae FACHB-1344]MCA2657224.1 restriction endonuclease subunit S [Microcystis sp. M049S2]MCZ8127436.1 restriction endonuclease subunit S [Microcystis sp. LE19-114.1B]
MKDWPSVALGDIFEIARGGSPRPIQNFLTEEPDGVNWVMIGDASDSSKYITHTKKRILKTGVKNSRMVYPGDFLLTNSMSFGHPYIMKTSGCIHDGWLVLSNKKGVIDQDYFYHLLGSDLIYAEFSRLASGSTVKNLNIEIVKGIKVSLPPLEEQRRIAAILDKADGVRRKRKEAIRLTEELLRSTFLEMFGDPVTNPKGWEVKRLGEICTNFQNGIGKNSEHYGHGSKVANISDLYEWHRFIPEKYSLLDVTPKEIEKYSLMRGDLLFVRSSVKREGVAVCSVYDSDEICLFSSFMIRVRPRTDLINPEFLSLMLRTPPMRNRLILGSNTSTITNISQPGLSKIEVVVPPIKTQNLITKVTKNIEESVRCHLQALEQSENLFNSLLQRAFRGEL